MSDNLNTVIFNHPQNFSILSMTICKIHILIRLLATPILVVDSKQRESLEDFFNYYPISTSFGILPHPRSANVKAGKSQSESSGMQINSDSHSRIQFIAWPNQCRRGAWGQRRYLKREQRTKNKEGNLFSHPSCFKMVQEGSCWLERAKSNPCVRPETSDNWDLSGALWCGHNLKITFHHCGKSTRKGRYLKG